MVDRPHSGEEFDRDDHGQIPASPEGETTREKEASSPDSTELPPHMHGEDGDPWRKFLEPDDSLDYVSGWLTITCGRTPDAEAGLLFMRGEGNRLGIAASWQMAGRVTEGFEKIAESLSRKPEPVVHGQESGALVGYPMVLNDEVQAILVIALKRHPGAGLRDLFRELHWATGWIESQLWRGKSALGGKQTASAELILEFLAAADQHERFDASALAVVNAVAELTGFERAAIGMSRHGRVRLEALSRAATFKRKADFVSEFEAAMDEAVAQADVIAYPKQAAGRNKIDLAHRRLAAQAGSGAIVTAPLIVRGKPVGALLLERSRGEEEVVSIDPDALEELRLAAAGIAPVLKLKYDERRWWSGRARSLLGRGLSAIFGRRPAIMLGTIAATILLTIPFLVLSEMRVSGQATLQGSQQRAAVSLVDGFVRDSEFRAGDYVKQGDVLARLDDRELRLQQSQNQARMIQAQQEVRDALSKGDRAAGAKASANLSEVKAALGLTETRLQRLEIRAPVTGLVVSGDLSQRLGAPVSRGDVLFEVARLDGYRVVIQVSEYDLSRIRENQPGELVLTSLPGEEIALAVTGISSVSEPADGENRFRLEADVDTLPDQARPGMEGVAKIATGRETLAWIWTRGTVNRLRVLFWRFWP